MLDALGGCLDVLFELGVLPCQEMFDSIESTRNYLEKRKFLELRNALVTLKFLMLSSLMWNGYMLC